MSEEKKKRVRVVTPFFRVSFPNVFVPKAAFKGQEPTYNIQMLFPKDGKHKANLEEIKKLVLQVAADKWGSDITKYPGSKKSPFKWPLRDGEEKELEAYKGMIFANAKSKMKPQILDRDKNEILAPTEFYGGCWARATISIYPFALTELGSYGVAFGLDNIQKVRDDASFNGKRNAKDDFEVIENDGSEDFKNSESESSVSVASAMDF